jgi:NADH:ubiquinone oxidoreductase subunit 5 (subunit L)/multisubunit Na+/H+ antiporter MnhA subunit
MGMFLFAGLSIAGMPPLNGFASKWLIFQACLQSGHYLLGLAALMGSLFTLASMLKFAHAAFMGQPSAEAAKMTEAPASMLVPMGALVVASIAVGFFPGLLLLPIAEIQQALGFEPVSATLAGPLPGVGGWTNGPMAILIVAAGALGFLYTKLGGSKVRQSHAHLCGNEFDLREAQVKASSMYEAPEGLIQTALPVPASSLEHNHAEEAHASGHGAPTQDDLGAVLQKGSAKHA